MIDKRLGRGGMGYVYHAYDPLIKRDVALKVIHPDMAEDHMLIERFKREAQSAGGLRHPNIVTIYDLGEDNGQPYIAMEFLEGTDLEQLIRSKADIPLEKKIDIVIQVCEGLDYAHKHGIVHRDITPSNIRILDNGLIKIMDFGIAKITSQQITQTGTLMGKPHYMSPEQVRGETIDGRTDIFALGVCLYEFLTFRKPFPGENTTSVLLKIISDTPEPLTDIRFTSNPQLEAIIFKALEKDAKKRFQTAKEMAEALKDFLPATKVTKVTTSIPTEIQETILTPPKIDAKTLTKQGVKTDSQAQIIQTFPTIQQESPEAPVTDAPTKLSTPAPGTKVASTVVPTKLATPGTDVTKFTSTDMPTQLSTPAGGTKLASTEIPTQLSSSFIEPAAPPVKYPTKVLAPQKKSSMMIVYIAAIVILLGVFGVYFVKNYILPAGKSSETQSSTSGNTASSNTVTVNTNSQQTNPVTNQNMQTNQTNTTNQNNQTNPIDQNDHNPPNTNPVTKAESPGFLKLNILPWGKIMKIKNETSGKISYPEDLYTPCYVTLEPGQYSMVVNNVELSKNETLTFTITAKEITPLTYKFQLFSNFSDDELAKD
jgi:serine/threonine protein kinase